MTTAASNRDDVVSFNVFTRATGSTWTGIESTELLVQEDVHAVLSKRGPAP
jgi:hypothetical protein